VVQVAGDTELVQVVLALNTVGGGARFLHRRQEQRTSTPMIAKTIKSSRSVKARRCMVSSQGSVAVGELTRPSTEPKISCY